MKNQLVANLENRVGRIGTYMVALSTMVLVAAFHITPASAEDVDLGRHKDWRAHSYAEQGGTVCNMWSRPTKHEEGGRPRGDIYAFVTHRPKLKTLSEVSFQMGYPLKPNSEVSVSIGSRKFSLFTEGEAAFARREDDEALAKAMKRGSRMLVRGESARGTKTVDTYSLSGFTAAHKAIDKACR